MARIVGASNTPHRIARRRSAGIAVIVAVMIAALTLIQPATVDAQHGHGQTPTNHDDNLAMIQNSPTRNTTQDDSAYKDVPMDQINLANHLGPRSAYLGNPGGNPEQAFPVVAGGQFRISCEFSHFAYDDPIVFPGQPGASHLHMFWGNTYTNAFTTEQSLIDSGSSTCNGQEVNRTGYWAPAVFDGSGNVRVPERIVVYYKGEGLANGASQVYPPGAAVIPSVDINTVSNFVGGTQGDDQFSYKCSNSSSSYPTSQANTFPSCAGSAGVSPHVVMEMNVKFPQCWNGQDASNPDNYDTPPYGSWYYSDCPAGWTTLPNLEYFINYPVELGENTNDWYLSSDIDPATFEQTAPGGTAIHADWWGAWKPEVNQEWLDRCVNFSVPNEASGCGMGYLSNGGPDNKNPLPGPALNFRDQYVGASSVPAAELYANLCTSDRQVTQAREAAYCTPAGHHHGPAPVPTPTPPPAPQPTGRTCLGEPATIVGTSGDDTLIGTNGRDVIWAGPGNDLIRAGGGNDLVCAGSGHDETHGEAGNDDIYAGPGSDALFGGAGNDHLAGGGSDDYLFGGTGDDTLVGGSGDDELQGQDGMDMLYGAAGSDLLKSGLGGDRLAGGPGPDTCVRPPGETGINNSCEVTSTGW